METISNIASTATSTVSNLIYGQPAKDKDATVGNETLGNETGGKEPISGEQGKGTAKEPFDQGNAATPAATSSSSNTYLDYDKTDTATSGETTAKSDDFLPLNPTIGKPSNTESFTETKTGGSHETGMPIVPLNPDVATMSSGTTNTSSTSHTGNTEKQGITDSIWKPTALDEIKPSGAPGAGPTAPEYTPATPETTQGSSAPSKEPVGRELDTPKHTSTSDTPKDLSTSDTPKDHTTTDTDTTSEKPKEGSSLENKHPVHDKHSVSEPIDSIIHPTPAAEHSVPDAEAEDPHSKMLSHTVRNTDASKHSADNDESKKLVEQHASHHHESTESHAPAAPSSASPTGAEEKEKDSKMAHLKDKFKNKLHIGSKDK